MRDTLNPFPGLATPVHPFVAFSSALAGLGGPASESAARNGAATSIAAANQNTADAEETLDVTTDHIAETLGVTGAPLSPSAGGGSAPPPVSSDRYARTAHEVIPNPFTPGEIRDLAADITREIQRPVNGQPVNWDSDMRMATYLRIKRILACEMLPPREAYTVCGVTTAAEVMDLGPRESTNAPTQYVGNEMHNREVRRG